FLLLGCSSTVASRRSRYGALLCRSPGEFFGFDWFLPHLPPRPALWYRSLRWAATEIGRHEPRRGPLLARWIASDLQTSPRARGRSTVPAKLPSSPVPSATPALATSADSAALAVPGSHGAGSGRGRPAR